MEFINTLYMNFKTNGLVSTLKKGMSYLVNKKKFPTKSDLLLEQSVNKALSNKTKIQNNKLNLVETSEKKINLQSNPTTYIFGLTNICNLKCPLCITGRGEQLKDKKFMDYELFTKIFDKIKDYAISIQLYNWGESLLHKDFIKMLKVVKSEGIVIQLSTNLNIDFNKELFEAMVDYSLDDLIISFDGLTQEVYGKYRINGDINLVLDNIKKLNDIKNEKKSNYPVIRLQFLKNKYNIQDIQDFLTNYPKLGADDAFIAETLLPFKCIDTNIAEEWIPENEINERIYLDVDLSAPHKNGTCPFLYNIMIVEQDGSIPPCCYTTDPKDDFYIFDENMTINQMYNSKKFKQARKMFNAPVLNDGDDYIVCKKCSFHKACRQS